jgi:hypothetical protein
VLTRTVRDVRPGDVSRTFSRGESAWSRRRDWQVGVRIGLFLVFGLPALIALASYFVHGGTLADLLPALLEEAVVFVGDVASVLGPLGCAIVIGALVVRARLRRKA